MRSNIHKVAFIELLHVMASMKGGLLVQRLGVGGGGSDVGIAGSLVGASLLLELLGGLQVGRAGIFVGLLVLAGGADEVSDSGVEVGEHC